MGAVLITVAFDFVLITAAAHGSAFKTLLFAGLMIAAIAALLGSQP
jgi:hypothetical protein